MWVPATSIGKNPWVETKGLGFELSITWVVGEFAYQNAMLGKKKVLPKVWWMKQSC